MSWSKLAPFGGQPDWVAVRVSYGFDPAGKFFFTGIFSRVTCLQSCRQQFHHFSLSPGSFIFSWRFYFKKRLRNIYPSPFYSPSHLFYFSCPHLPFPTPNLAIIICSLHSGMFYLENVALSKVKVKSLSRAWLFATPWTVLHQASPSIVFSRQRYWGGLPFPSPGKPVLKKR